MIKESLLASVIILAGIPILVITLALVVTYPEAAVLAAIVTFIVVKHRQHQNATREPEDREPNESWDRYESGGPLWSWGSRRFNEGRSGSAPEIGRYR